MSRPFVLGLTGSVGMGKSTVAGMFQSLGVPVFDADAVVHRLQGPGGAVVKQIETAFPGTTGPEGVDRRKLGAVVFDDPEALARLEAIVHPAVRAARREFLQEHAGARLVVPPVPLCTDNGAMVAWAGAERLALGETDGLDISAKARWPLDSADMGLTHAA